MTGLDLAPRGRRRPVARRDLVVPVVELAERLLGLLLVRREDDGTDTVVRVVETEAYRRDDPASHSHRGPTRANAAMFGPAGHAYVYFTYGMHHCVNVTGGPRGQAGAVLLRAGVVLTNLDLVRARRGAARRDVELAAGPARLARALDLDRTWDGVDVCARRGRLRLLRDAVAVPAGQVRAGPRVGVREAADVPWRRWVDGVAEVSGYRRHPRAAPPA